MVFVNLDFISSFGFATRRLFLPFRRKLVNGKKPLIYICHNF
jgi:hypothetical protein